MPLAAEAYVSGRLDGRVMSALVRAHNEYPEPYRRDEAVLVEQAGDLTVGDFRKVLAYWRQAAADAEGDIEALAAAEHRRRRLHISVTWDNTTVGDFRLGAEDGSTVATALRSLADPWIRDPEDERTPAQARADALVEICRRFLDGRRQSGTSRPHVTVMVDLETLEGRAGYRAEASNGVITPEAARRIACDARITRIITESRSQPLDVGRTTRTISGAMRRALVVRDRTCVADGCETPHEWCDAHHLVHWADGGETSLPNLVLLCRRHHRMWHDRGSPQLE